MNLLICSEAELLLVAEKCVSTGPPQFSGKRVCKQEEETGVPPWAPWGPWAPWPWGTWRAAASSAPSGPARKRRDHYLALRHKGLDSALLPSLDRRVAYLTPKSMKHLNVERSKVSALREFAGQRFRNTNSRKPNLSERLRRR